MRRRIVLLALSFAILPTRIEAQALSPRDIAARARAASVLIQGMAGGEVISQGSGFLVSADGKIVTNRHVIEDARSLQVQLATGEIYDRVFLVADDERRDLAILRIPATNLPYLRIGDDQALQVGDRIYVMGNPMGLEGTFSDGLVSAKRTLVGVALIQISAPISPGSSGGPVLNARGQAVGVATLMMSEGQNLNIAVPARYAEGLLAIGQEPVLFEQVASRFAVNDLPEPPSRTTPRPPPSAPPASNRGNAGTWSDGLGDEVDDIQRLARQYGVKQLYYPRTGRLARFRTETLRFVLGPRSGEVVIMAVCDAACTDIDISVTDPSSKTVGTDAKGASPRAGVTFRPTVAGEYKVRVFMAGCERSECGYAVIPYGTY